MILTKTDCKTIDEQGNVPSDLETIAICGVPRISVYLQRDHSWIFGT